jgi:hypothetical protein
MILTAGDLHNAYVAINNRLIVQNYKRIWVRLQLTEDTALD